MSLIFWLALIILVISIPAILVILGFYLLSRKFHFDFQVVGYLKFKDIVFFYESEAVQINFRLEKFQIYLIWFRCRLFLKGLVFNVILSNRTLLFLKSRPVNKAEFMDTFVIKRKKVQGKGKEEPKILKELKNSFFEIINQKYILKHSSKDKESSNSQYSQNSTQEEEVIDNLIKKSEISKKENFLRNLLTFFDLLIEDSNVNFKLSEYNSYHSLSFRKIILGGVKGINKHKEIHVIFIAYDMKLKELTSSFNMNKEYMENTLSSINKVFINVKLEYGLFPKSFYTLINTVNLNCEVNKVRLEFSTRAIKQIFKIIRQIIKLSKINEKNKNFSNTNDLNTNKKPSLNNNIISKQDEIFFTDVPVNIKKRTSFEIDISPEMLVECVEEIIIKKVSSQMKKVKIKVNDFEAKIVSDNHNYIFTHLNFSNLMYQTKNEFNYYCDNSKVKLLKSSGEIKISDLVLSSYKKEKVILDLQNFTMNMTDDVIYYYQSKEGAFKSSVSMETPGMDVVMSTRELDKVIELIICIVVGLEKIEANSERNVYIHKYYEKYLMTSYLNLNFDNANVTVYDEVIQAEINNISVGVKIEEDKFNGGKIDIFFSPIVVSVFSKNMTNYASHIIVKGFKLKINDDNFNSHVDIVFEDTKVLVYDNHLIDAMRFIADFLTYCLRGGVRKIHKKKAKVETNYKSKYSNIIPNDVPYKKKELVTLLFKKAVVYNYIDFDDLLTLKIEDYNFHVDNWMLMPRVRIYHQSLSNLFLRKRSEFIDLQRFFIKFIPANNEVNIEFEHITLNAYCFELGFAIVKLSIYHSFLPVWINFHMAYKHNIDEDYRKIYVTDFAKKDRTTIRFGTVIVKINQHSISNAAILQTRPELMKEIDKSSFNSITYLKSVKSDQITIQVKNFLIATSGYKEKESANEHLLTEEEIEEEKVSKMRSINYYKKISRKGQVDIIFETIDIFQENSKLVEMSNFKIILNDEIVYDNFDLEKLNSIACSFKMHNIFYKELNSRKTKHTKIEIIIDNLKLNLEDIKIIDKISLFYLMGLKKLLSFPFKDYALSEIMDNQENVMSKNLDIYLKNFETVVNSIDPLNNLIYNRLYLKIDLLSVSIEENSKVNKMEISLFYFTFGFEFSQNFDYPLLILPVLEVNIDNSTNTIRINVPSKSIKKLKKGKKEDNPLVPDDNIYITELDKFIMETKSLTLFLSFNYLNTFDKIFENFWKRSPFVKKYFFGSTKNVTKNEDNVNIKLDNTKTNRNFKMNESLVYLDENYNKSANDMSIKYITPGNNDNKDKFQFDDKEENKIFSNDNSGSITSKSVSKTSQPFKLLFTVFDLKIIYLLQFKNEYNSIFKFHNEVKEKGYFGYIIRFYSISLKYLSDSESNLKRDELKLNTNLFTVSFLQQENFDDDKFFLFDKEIKYSHFVNLKVQSNFNDFMQIAANNRYRLINKNFLKFFIYETDEEFSLLNKKKKNSLLNVIVTSPVNRLHQHEATKNSEYVDLIFDYKHTLMKIFDISFKRDTMSVKKIEEIYIKVSDIKFTWNKFNMDVISVLLFKDVLLIVDKIILRIDSNNGINKTSPKEEVMPFVSDLDLGRFNFVFELNNPQICIQNEIKDSKVLLTTKSKCSAKISKICMNENSKDFKLDIQLNSMALYIAPNYMDSSYIYWIGDSEDNIYYIEEKLFNKMLETPKIQFLIFENIKNNLKNTHADTYTNLTISVDKIAADFGSHHFNHFLNVIDVFIFDRGYSYAEQKQNLDSRAKDLEIFKLEVIQNRIKNNLTTFISNKKTKQKEINFTLKDVVLTMLKDNREIIKLMMRNFEGEHIIYTDKSSETSINVKNLKILDLFKNRNETILSPNFEVQNIGELENKIDLVTFRKKDSFVSIGTDSKWYVLDYYELNILPLLINTSKDHCDFIIEFFFDHNETANKSEQEQKKILMGHDKEMPNRIQSNPNQITENVTQNKEVKTKTDKTQVEVSYPIYFKHVKINETQLFISFFLADNSPFNLRNAKLKFSAFEKKDKFYTGGDLLNRFIGHLKFISFTNASNILASFFNWGGGSVPKRKKRDDEEAHRKMLLGNQYNK